MAYFFRRLESIMLRKPWLSIRNKRLTGHILMPHRKQKNRGFLSLPYLLCGKNVNPQSLPPTRLYLLRFLQPPIQLLTRDQGFKHIPVVG